jgi:chemotaxis protein CheD
MRAILGSPANHSSESPRDVHLGVGEVHLALKPTVARTVLGSCVAVILYAPSRKVSALCHAVLPSPTNASRSCRDTCAKPCSGPYPRDCTELHYVTCCIDYMLEHLGAAGIASHQLACALVGGASARALSNPLGSVGDQNVATARSVLDAHDIRIRHEDVGGSVGRTLTYRTDNGRLRVRPTSR